MRERGVETRERENGKGREEKGLAMSWSASGSSFLFSMLKSIAHPATNDKSNHETMQGAFY